MEKQVYLLCPQRPQHCSQLLSSAWDQELGPKERMSVESGGVRKKEESKGIKWGGGRARREGREDSRAGGKSLGSEPDQWSHQSLGSLGGTSLMAKTSRG